MSQEFTYKLIGTKIMRRTGFHVCPTHAHWCPACEEMHDFAVEQPFRNGARWSFNGDGNAPHFEPSMNYAVGPTPSGKTFRCHYFLKNGQIQYLADCTHAMVGQTIKCPDVPEQVLLRAGIRP